MSMIGRDGTDPDSPFDDLPLDDPRTARWHPARTPVEPGGHLGPGDLAPDEERLLAALERDARTSRTASVEEIDPDGPRGRGRGAPRPPTGGAPDDGLTPLFAAPEFEEDD